MCFGHARRWFIRSRGIVGWRREVRVLAVLFGNSEIEVGDWADLACECKGMRSQTPRLWVYFAVGQILPVSFSQNLFLIAGELIPGSPPGEDRDDEKARPDVQHHASVSPAVSTEKIKIIAIAALFCYHQCLHVAPQTVGSAMLFPVLFATRLLLLSPLFVVWLSKQRYEVGIFTKYLVVACSGWLLADSWYTWWPATMEGAVDALHANPALSALGYDLLIGVGSLAVHSLLGCIEST